jgi:NDP-sugar pyrophosphorylase family protein
MQIGAIVVLGERSSFRDTREHVGFARPGTEPLECLAETPIAALELLGQSPLQRMIAYLENLGVQAISLVTRSDVSHLQIGTSGCTAANALVDPSAGTWFAIERAFAEYVRNGCETILLVRLGAYVEFNFANLLQFHRGQEQPLTRLMGADGPLDFWMVDATHFRKTGTHFRKETCMAGAGAVSEYDKAIYVNPLSHARDVRQLVVDAFAGRYSIRPCGRETMPGVWLGDNARLHPRARVEGPCYIGRGATVETTASITRFSSVERCCRISSGTAVADASILAHTYLGAWLKVSHAVVYGNRIAHLRHNVTVDIHDDRLIRNISLVSPVRPLLPRFLESFARLKPAMAIFKPRLSVIKAARAVFLTKRTQ